MARLRFNGTFAAGSAPSVSQVADVAALKTSLAAALVTANAAIVIAKAQSVTDGATATTSALTTVQTDMTAVGVVATAIVGTADLIVDVNLANITSLEQLRAAFRLIVASFKEQGLS